MQFQIGKNGVTPGVIDALNKGFETHKHIRISALKASGRDKESMTKIAEDIKSRLPLETVFKIIGFTIILSRRHGNGKPSIRSKAKKVKRYSFFKQQKNSSKKI